MIAVAAKPTINPEKWLIERGWIRFVRQNGEVYWRKTPNEEGWEGGWNTGGAVHCELEAFNTALLKEMGLYVPPSRSRRRR